MVFNSMVGFSNSNANTGYAAVACAGNHQISTDATALGAWEVLTGVEQIQFPPHWSLTTTTRTVIPYFFDHSNPESLGAHAIVTCQLKLGYDHSKSPKLKHKLNI
jgi:hypothetical protein